MSKRSPLRKRLRNESGQSILTFMLIAMLVLVLTIGLLHDLGALAVAQVRAQDAADLAVQDAVRQGLDLNAFYAGQQISLTSGAVPLAQQRLRTYYGAREGEIELLNLYLTRPDARHWTLTLEARLEVPTRFLSWVGIPHIERYLRATAVPAFGAEQEGQ